MRLAEGFICKKNVETLRSIPKNFRRYFSKKFTILKPLPAARTVPARLRRALDKAKTRLPWLKSQKVSMAKAEYVVSPPKKPVDRKDFIVGEKTVVCINSANKIPITKLPMRLTLSVPNGKTCDRLRLTRPLR